MLLFTIDHANRMLPLVRRIVGDIVSEHRRWQEALIELDLIATIASSELLGSRVAEVEKRIQRIASDIDGFERELEALGVQLKDRRIGLIDFPSELEGRPMLLCWRLGEESVQYWHDVDAGYAGRQLLTPSLAG